MSNSSPPCPKHPSQPLVGVCASCLREKLATFVDSEEREGDIGSFVSSPTAVSKSIAIGSPFIHDSPTPELHAAAAMETCTSPQGGFSQITRSSSFNEKLARLSPISSIKKKSSLSYYFDLHDNEGLSTIHNSHKTTRSSTSVELHSPLYAPSNAAHGRNEERKHGSFSVRGHRSQLLDVGESGAPFSWLSALFSKRREKQKARSKQTLTSWRACSSGGGHGFEGAYGNSSSSLSWEAPRPSSWEQLSSWEKPWELPSLYNAEPTRASDADLHDYNPAIASQSVQANQRIGHGFAVERKQGLHRNKIWIKALLSNKWAIKLKSGLIKKRQQAGVDSDDDDDQASTISEAASFARESNQYRHHSQNHYSVQNHSSMQQYAMQNRQMKACQDGARHGQREIGSNRRGYGAWDSYYSPAQSASVDGLKARQRYKSNSALLKGESGDMSSKHNGLLKLYLTPVRGISSRGKSKQWVSRADVFNP